MWNLGHQFNTYGIYYVQRNSFNIRIRKWIVPWYQSFLFHLLVTIFHLFPSFPGHRKLLRLYPGNINYDTSEVEIHLRLIFTSNPKMTMRLSSILISSPSCTPEIYKKKKKCSSSICLLNFLFALFHQCRFLLNCWIILLA